MHNLPVRLIASGGGAVYAPLGPTHMAFDDFAKYANQVFAKRVSMVNGVSQVQVTVQYPFDANTPGLSALSGLLQQTATYSY